ncbi:MAG TPA: polysaccharide biosynthesis/export family protein [Terracidiphilus sp.]|jgi:polysaccharide export outer membrane protein|nr:polysaccharide biosynthesis/export family protein [Terracidiphilus sp.]
MPRISATHSIRILVAGLCVFAIGATAWGQQGAAAQANVDPASESARRPQPAATTMIGTVPEGFVALKLRPGMLLQMEVYGVPEMSAQLRVDAEGNVTVPLGGAIQVNGQTVAQAQALIAKILAEREMIIDPQVVLDVLQYPASHVSVIGEVQIPGQIELLSPRPIAEVLARAGGTTPAAGNEIEIQRRDESGEVKVQHLLLTRDSDQAILDRALVEPGDTVLVHRAGVIYVLGAVNRPGGYLMVNSGSLSVVQAISLAGGEALQASTRWATIVRQSERRIEQIKIPLHKMETGELPAAELQINDALYVPTSGWKTAVMNGSNVLSAAAAASIYSAANRP